MNKIKIRFWLRNRTLYCYLIVNKEKSSSFSVNINVSSQEMWDCKNQRIKNCDLDNDILSEIKTKIKLLAIELERNNQSYNANILKNYYMNSITPPKSAKLVFDELIQHKCKQDKELRTVQTYRTRMNILCKYLEICKNTNITIKEIDMRFVQRYKNWLSEVYPPQRSNYANKALQAIYSLLKFAVQSQYIDTNPAEYLEYFPTIVKPKIYLTMAELEQLEKFHFPQKSLERVRDLFLWQCYTGMDYSTMTEFKNEFVKKSQLGLYIDGKRIKSGTRYVLPFFEKAQSIWNKYGQSLPIISNQKYNTYLKAVVEMAGIEKKITTHSGRKTFANLFESKGIDRRTIADMLGHKKVETTLKHYSEVQIEGIFHKLKQAG